MVHRFDLDICQVLYDGTHVRATRNALRACHTGAMIVQPNNVSRTLSVRLAKYSKRHGVDIVVLGLHPIILQFCKNVMTDGHKTLVQQLVADVATKKEAGAFTYEVTQLRETCMELVQRNPSLKPVTQYDGLDRLLAIADLASKGSDWNREARTLYELVGGSLHHCCACCSTFNCLWNLQAYTNQTNQWDGDTINMDNFRYGTSG